MPNYKYTDPDRPVDPSIFRTWLEKAPSDRYRSLLAFIYIFGPRVSEATHVKFSDYYFEGTQEKTEKFCVWIPTLKNKGLDYRLLKANIKTPFLDIVVKYLTENKALEGSPWPWLVSRIQVWRVFHKIDPDCIPHKFRHNRLTKFAERGATAFEIRDFAGHTDTRPASSYIKNSGVLAHNLEERIGIE